MCACVCVCVCVCIFVLNYIFLSAFHSCFSSFLKLVHISDLRIKQTVADIEQAKIDLVEQKRLRKNRQGSQSYGFHLKCIAATATVGDK